MLVILAHHVSFALVLVWSSTFSTSSAPTLLYFYHPAVMNTHLIHGQQDGLVGHTKSAHKDYCSLSLPMSSDNEIEKYNLLPILVAVKQKREREVCRFTHLSRWFFPLLHFYYSIRSDCRREKDSKEGRRTVFFTAVNPMNDPQSDEPYNVNEPREVPHWTKWKWLPECSLLDPPSQKKEDWHFGKHIPTLLSSATLCQATVL